MGLSLVLVALFAQVAAGLRVALFLFAAMSLLTKPRRRSPFDENWLLQLELAHKHNARAWSLIAWAAVLFSPLQSALLLGHPAPALVARAADVAVSAMGCAGFVQLLAARGHAIGLSPERVRRGELTNLGVALALVGAIWLTP